jgi:hypothetical protein
MTERDDIDEVRKLDERRGKRPIDIAAKKRRLILQRKFTEALESNNVELFSEALIHDLGQLPGTPEYAQSMKVWKRFQGRS